MAKTLATIRVSLKEIQGRVDPFLVEMGKLNDAFWNETVGAWGRYYSGIDLLGEEADADQQRANNRVSGWQGADAEILRGIEGAKADCLKISKEYWLTAKRVDAIRKQVDALVRTCDAAVAKKAKKVKRSQSIDELRALSKDLENFSASLGLATSVGPHKPEHKLLK